MYRLRSWSSKNRGDICDSGFSGIEDAKFWLGVSTKYWKSKLRMRNFTGEYLHVIENVGCRCKICKGSIFKSQKRQDVDAIYTWQAGLKVSASSKKSKLQIHWSRKEHLQQKILRSCRYIGLKKSICNNEYQGLADTSVATKTSVQANNLMI